jgi:hypothetical protein
MLPSLKRFLDEIEGFDIICRKLSEFLEQYPPALEAQDLVTLSLLNPQIESLLSGAVAANDHLLKSAQEVGEELGIEFSFEGVLETLSEEEKEIFTQGLRSHAEAAMSLQDLALKAGEALAAQKQAFTPPKHLH